MNLRRTHINQRGVSLVELMIAMLLGLFLMIGVIQVFVSSKSTYNTQESLSRVQESGRHAIGILSRDLRMAGFTGCGGASENVFNNLSNEADFILNFSEGVFGSEAAGTGPGDELDLADDDPDGAWSPDLPAGTGSVDIQPLPGSDVLVVRTVSSGILTAEPPPGQDKIGGSPPASPLVHMTSGNHDFQQGEILLITDCANAGIVRMNQASEVIINFSGSGNKSPGNWPDENAITGDASAARIEAAVYFVGLNDEDVPTLYRQNLSTAAAGGAAPDPQAIIEGAENMQVLYGTRATGTTTLQVDQFRTAAQIDAASRWPDVIAVQVALLVRDEDRLPGGIADRARTFTLGGYDLTVEPDGLQRQIFRSTITLRNKAL